MPKMSYKIFTQEEIDEIISYIRETYENLKIEDKGYYISLTFIKNPQKHFSDEFNIMNLFMYVDNVTDTVSEDKHVITFGILKKEVPDYVLEELLDEAGQTISAYCNLSADFIKRNIDKLSPRIMVKYNEYLDKDIKDFLRMFV
jgi:hypothetical protein